MNKSTSSVVLNSADIDVSFASFSAPGGSEIQAKEINYNKDEEKVILTFPENLPTGFNVFLLCFYLVLYLCTGAATGGIRRTSPPLLKMHNFTKII